LYLGNFKKYMLTQTTTLTKINIIYLTKFVLLLVIATFAPAIGFHSQWITGPIVNAVLILSVFMVGARGALLIGMLPSTIALSTGLLSVVLAPMIPFIIISNSILILILSLCHPEQSKESVAIKYSKYWLILFFGALLKFIFLFLTSGIVIKLLINIAVAPKVAAMMSWPQFVTAMIGGVIAFIVLKIVLKHDSFA